MCDGIENRIKPAITHVPSQIADVIRNIFAEFIGHPPSRLDISLFKNKADHLYFVRPENYFQKFPFFVVQVMIFDQNFQ